MKRADFLGAGIGYRRRYRAALLGADATEGPEVLEILAEHFFADPAALEPLAARYPLVVHGLGLSVATATRGADLVGRSRLASLRRLFDVARPALYSDHLALTRSAAGIDLGHLAPVWYTSSMLALVADRIRAWQDALGVPVALENIASPFVIGQADMTEAEFFSRLVERTGCSVLLDLTNLAVDAHNHGFDPFERVRDYPLEAVVQVHLAGGVERDGWWIDSHTEPVASTSYRLLGALRSRAPLRAIIVERDDKLPALGQLVAEARRAAEIWRHAE